MSFVETLLIKTAGARLFIRDHEAGIEIGAGIACFAMSVAMAARAGIKTKQIMSEYQEARSRDEAALAAGMVTVYEDNQQEIIPYSAEDHKKRTRNLKLRTVGKVALAWTPSLLGFAGGTGLVLRSHHVMVKSNLGLAAALKASEEALEKYRAKIGEKIGTDEEQKVYEGKEVKKVAGKKKPECLQGTPLSPYARLMSRDTVERDGDWYNSSDEYNKQHIKNAEMWANRQLRMHGRVTYNEVLKFIGLPISEDGDVVGWRLIKCGGKTDYNGIYINIYEHLGGNPDDIHYVKDEWGDMIRAADPFWIDFNIEGCILGASTVNKLGG